MLEWIISYFFILDFNDWQHTVSISNVVYMYSALHALINFIAMEE